MQRASHATRRVRTRVPKFRFMNEVGGPQSNHQYP